MYSWRVNYFIADHWNNTMQQSVPPAFYFAVRLRAFSDTILLCSL